MTKVSLPHAFYTCFEGCRHVFHFLSGFWAAKNPLISMVGAGVLGRAAVSSLYPQPWRAPPAKHLGRDSHHGAVCVVVGGTRESLGTVRIHFRREHWAAFDVQVGRGASSLSLTVHS